VPGVFWCNREIATDTPNLMDIAPTALDLFGVPVPGYMQGKQLFEPVPAGGPDGDRAAPVRRAAGEEVRA
jgi:arylsulfatase A-like enzyme